MTTEEQLPVSIQNLDSFQQRLYAASATWLKPFRNRSFNQLSFETIPTIKDEEWKYTSISEAFKKNLRLPERFDLLEQKQIKDYLDPQEINVVLVNGVLNRDLSTLSALPKGVTINTFNKVQDIIGQEIQESLTKMTPNDTKSLWWMNGAFFLDGVVVKIEKDIVLDKLIHLVHVSSDLEADSIVFPRVFISVGENARANVMESHVGYGQVNYIANAVTDIKVAKAAYLSYCKAECEHAKAIHLATTRMWQERESHVETFSFAHGALLVRNNLSILLKGEGTNTTMNGFYAIDGDQHVDNHTLLDIQQPNCTSYQLYKGILNDCSRAVFNGKIYVHSAAQQTNGYQLNKHLLLGSQARVDTKPQLEIFADDVKCTHGATIGQLNEEEVFYLQSRCIPKTTAIQLLSKGFIDDIIQTIKSESVRLKLHQLLAKKFPEVKI